LSLYRLGLRELRFRGAFANREEALAAIPRGRLAGYDNDAIADVSFEKMCRIEIWDWPVLYWLWRVGAEQKVLLDIGGHQGTKYRAFLDHLPVDNGLRWVVYDLPAIVRAGRERAAREGLTNLTFVDELGDAPPADVALLSGVLQYVDTPIDELIRRLRTPPRHLVCNKVATRQGPTLWTLENFGRAEVPYRIRNYSEFLSRLDGMGYDVVDEWEIPALSHVIPTHVELGASASVGLFARRRD